MKARIIIDGAWAKLTGANASALQETLAPYDPQRWFNPAFKQKRWDGRVRLYEGKKFPAGLWRTVAHYLFEHDIEYELIDNNESEEVPLDDWSKDILPGITLYAHQDDVCRTLLSESRGVAKSPTGSGKTEDMIAIALYLWRVMGWRTLIVTSKKGLAKQTAERARHYVGDELTVGQCGDGKKTFGEIVVGTAQTLIGFQSRKRKRRGKNIYDTIPPDPDLVEVVKNYEVIMFDEAHHASSDTWYQIGMASKAKRRYGFSGTPLKEDEPADLKLQGVTGPILIEVPPDALIEAGLAAKPKIAMVMSDSASHDALPEVWDPERNKPRPMPYADAYREGIVESVSHNRAVVRSIEWLTDRKRRTLVICRQKAHFRILEAMLEEQGVNYGAAWGDTDTDERDRLKDYLSERKIDCLLSTTIFDEGEDVPAIDAIVLAEGIKSPTNAIQRIGRGMRRKKGDNDLWVVDFVPLCHDVLKRHAEKRAVAYEDEGYEVMVVEEWPTEEEDAPDDLLPFLAWEGAYAT